jgi:retron-type reverse transcriptase
MKKTDVLAFARRAEDSIFSLHEQLRGGAYTHDPYEHFFVHDPKKRYISKTSVKDRIVHQAVVQVIEPFFEKQFIFDSFASRKGKGTHAAVLRLAKFLRQASANYRYPTFALKCDIRKFFDSVRHDILVGIIQRNMPDDQLVKLIVTIIESYRIGGDRRGLPLGNVTSQLFANMYLNEFDHFVKERLQSRWYIRFCDDFIILHKDLAVLLSFLPLIREFLGRMRALELHPQKLCIRKFSHGVDFVGQVLRPHYRILRTKTKRRMFRNMRLHAEEYRHGLLSDEEWRQSLQSYLGILSDGEQHMARECFKEEAWHRLRSFYSL